MLSGSVVVVTGASTGIGRAIAMAAARAGADLVVTYQRNADAARATEADIQSLGRRVLVRRLDVTDAAAIERFGPEVVTAFGRIDAWINNAGADILTGEGATLSPMQRLDRLVAVDLRGTIAASWHAAALMRAQPAGGVIINMSWDHVFEGMPGTNPELFAAVKGGVEAFSKALARSLAPRVRVNVLAPGWIHTAFGSALDVTRHETIRASIPLGRWGTPEDVASAAVFLASPGASYITGQTLVVGGGVVMR